MSTQGLVTTLRDDYFPAYGRSKLLSYLNRVQNWAFTHDCAQTTFLNWDDDSFPVPILKTTSGKLGKYYLTESTLVDSDGNAISLKIGAYAITIRRIRRIFIQVATLNDLGYSNKWYGQDFDWAGVNPNWTKGVWNITFESVPGYPQDKREIEGAHFIFAEDPTTTTDKCFAEMYYNAVPLTSESIPMCIDIEAWFEMLLSGVSSIIEDIENGTSQKWKEFTAYWKPIWLNSQNEGVEQSRPKQIPIREAG